ncbi:hypothetical protein A0J61_07268 [Choanephora cucurbitarum]|uniref:Uncharacterized protein n=1 Tax=Choanephora cucurbitarum TaxID=101091 RepID=A0A1C7N6C0_9FUNG|nr:hypothetical protein A0J61_07268 [Choanephora cucurbitarum]
MEGCGLWDLIQDQQLGPCARERNINLLCVLFILLCSFSIILCNVITHLQNKKREYLHRPLNQANFQKTSNYGATSSPESRFESSSLESQESCTPVSQPWSLYSCARLLLSGFQLTITVYVTCSLAQDSSDINTLIEGDYNSLMQMYYGRIAFWVFCTLAALFFLDNVWLKTKAQSLTDQSVS